ncbi:addiction module protein [Candidatus Poribacteria bacterium]|nr:MAG: addiction module protein [Candidatus Poribacteria bacterium]
MRNTEPRRLQVYRNQNGRQPFTEWFYAIRDTKTRTRIRKRLDRLEDGNFGNHKSVGDGVFELLLHFGPGYRIYFAHSDNMIILLLCGGDKSSQRQDIVRAKNYWAQYKEAQGWQN